MLELGVVLPTREALRHHDASLVSAVAVAAEANGFDAVWAGDSLLARPLIDPLTALATAAAVTERVRVGTAALLAPMRPPVLTAAALASLDQLSGGRLTVAVGRGFDLPETRAEYAAAGVPFEERTKRLNEVFSQWPTLWTSDESSEIDLRPKPAQPGGPPLWLAGYGPAAFRRTGQLADGWLPYPPTPELYAEGLAAVRSRAEEAGRDPNAITPACMVTVGFDQESLSRYVAEIYGYPLEVVSIIQACRAGSATELADWLAAYFEAGVRSFVIRLA
jgi:alkanesulfonate monooxygenase SsuD/methylene tetrahydromethanopterin reductase-like flavin-dependent oxidoreductase (luciferase family)